MVYQSGSGAHSHERGSVCNMGPITNMDKSTVNGAAYFTNEEQTVILTNSMKSNT